jgi:exodeoxyribonuclease VII large subunit
MAEHINDKKVFSLLEVTQSIQKTIAERYTKSFWVKAEMNKLNHYSHSGHCYPELVEKSDGRTIAQMKATLWKSDYLIINENFLRTLHEPLKDGIKILFCATIQFDPAHGLSLRILDIDPVFSLGELEREKQETLEKLRKEGIFDHNKKLSLPLLPQRIAIISVETSKGYADYLKVLEQNTWGYKFFNFLFPALLQGDRSVPSIIYQLNRIRKVIHHFDIVAIVRGGGGDVGLSSYNHYDLAREIALFPIPVFTGIGHSTNETVAEMISHRNAITPTELADFLLQRFHDFSVPLHAAEERIVDLTQRILTDEKSRFESVVRYFRSATAYSIQRHHHNVRNLSVQMIHQSRFLLGQKKQEAENQTDQLRKAINGTLSGNHLVLSNIEKHITILDPVNVLRRGYSITLLNGKSVQDVSQVKPGDTLTIIVANGQIESEIKKSKINE